MAYDKIERVHKLRKMMLDRIVAKSLDFFMHHHRSTSDTPMSFKDMPYLKQIYLDASPQIALMSSVQTGKSEWALIKGFACVDLGLNVFHVFSTGEAKTSFVRSRINDLCDRVQVYKDMEHDSKRNTYLRSIGRAHWKFVLSNSKAQFDEFPADASMVDEYDSCNEENIPLIDTRLENSNYKFKWNLGNPTVDGYGIAYFFRHSTANEGITCARNAASISWPISCRRWSTRSGTRTASTVNTNCMIPSGRRTAAAIYS
jgi:hypothetical protein